MDILRDNYIFKILLVLVSLCLCSCDTHNIKELEKVSDFKLSDKIFFEKKIEQGDNFQGNGYKILIFSFSDVSYFETEIKMNNKFKQFSFNDSQNPFSNSEITPYIRNGKGYYRSILEENKITTLVIDLANKKLVYYYNLM